MSKKSKALKKAAENPATSPQWYVEVSDTFNRSEPNRQLTGLLMTEDEAREQAASLKPTLGAFDKLYVVGPNNSRYSF
jgi:hypothetical protein